MRAISALSLLLLVTACGGGSTQPTPPPPPPPPPANSLPVVTSAGTASVPENTAGVFYQATATDADGDPITFSLSGGDAHLFTITAQGALRFNAPPDFEAPADSSKDNIYQLFIAATDGKQQSLRELLVTVTNVGEVTTLVQIGRTYAIGSVESIVPVPGTNQIFVAQSDGRIFIVDPNAPYAPGAGTPYLTVGNISSLLNIVAAPDYASSGALYVSVFNLAGDLEVRRYGRLNPAAGDPASADVLFRLARTQEDVGGFPVFRGVTRGGWLGFGPDGLLYVATSSRSQLRSTRLDNLAGKILRIDVSRDDFPADPDRDYGIPASNPFATSATAREIFVYGFDNDRKASFNGDTLLIGEEFGGGGGGATVSMVRPQDAGKVYDIPFPPETGPSQREVIRIPQSPVTLSSFVTGGYVYRGPSPQLSGLYIFYAAYPNGEGIKSIPAANLVQGEVRGEKDYTHFQTTTFPVTTFGEDAQGNLYFASGNDLFMYRVSG